MPSWVRKRQIGRMAFGRGVVVVGIAVGASGIDALVNWFVVVTAGGSVDPATVAVVAGSEAAADTVVFPLRVPFVALPVARLVTVVLAAVETVVLVCALLQLATVFRLRGASWAEHSATSVPLARTKRSRPVQSSGTQTAPGVRHLVVGLIQRSG